MSADHLKEAKQQLQNQFDEVLTRDLKNKLLAQEQQKAVIKREEDKLKKLEDETQELSSATLETHFISTMDHHTFQHSEGVLVKK
jgi:hypothetical protein